MGEYGIERRKLFFDLEFRVLDQDGIYFREELLIFKVWKGIFRKVCRRLDVRVRKVEIKDELDIVQRDIEGLVVCCKKILEEVGWSGWRVMESIILLCDFFIYLLFFSFG